jgi:hypothetical protein
MAVKGQRTRETLIAGADLSSFQNRVIEIDGTLAVENDTALGVLENKPQSGEHASVAVDGKMKGIAGAAVAAGARVKVASGGFLITVTSGTGTCGKNTNAAVASGDHFEFWGDFRAATTTFDGQ